MTIGDEKVVACLICGGDGVDPEPYVALQCCGNGIRGECCGDPDQEMQPQPCRQCHGDGRVIPQSAYASLLEEKNQVAAELASMTAERHRYFARSFNAESQLAELRGSLTGLVGRYPAGSSERFTSGRGHVVNEEWMDELRTLAAADGGST